LEFNREDEQFQDWVRDIGQRLAALGDEDSPVLNVEQLFEFARLDREIWCMRQQLCQVGRGYGDTPSNRAQEIGHWLKYMEDGLFDVLAKRQQSADFTTLLPFFAQLRTDDTIVTFYYDTIAEICIAEAGLAWWHGFEDEKARGLTVLKLHGSVDWWLVPRGRAFRGMERLFVKVDTNARDHGHTPDSKEDEYWYELHRASDLACASRRYDEYTGISIGFPARPGLAGLGAHKPLHSLPGSAVVWSRADLPLRSADEVYVIGWSASPFDSMARFHFRSVLMMRDAAPARVVVVDPNVNNCGNKKNFESVFGDIQAQAKKVEDVDWKAPRSTS